MNFFCTKKDYDAWVVEMEIDERSIFCLNAEEAIKVSKMLFSVTDI